MEQQLRRRKLGTPDAGGVQFAFGDGSVRTLNYSMDTTIVRRLISAQDGQVVSF